MLRMTYSSIGLFFKLCAMLAFHFSDVHGVRISNLIVPHQVGRGQNITLHCQFGVDRLQTLSSVKWYKGSHEFFRVVLGSTRRFRHFPLENLTVDAERSNVSSVVLVNVQKSNAGTYKCEVSVEPSWETDQREANLSVIDLPNHDPIITNDQMSYQLGESITLNCTLPYSKPTAVVEWRIDGNSAPDFYVKHHAHGSTLSSLRNKPTDYRPTVGVQMKGSTNTADELQNEDEGTVIGLEFAITDYSMRRRFSHPVSFINVTCVATVGDIYRQETQKSLKIIIPDNSHPPVKISSTIRPPSHIKSNSGKGPSYLGDCGTLTLIISSYVVNLLLQTTA